MSDVYQQEPARPPVTVCDFCWPDPAKTVVWRNGVGRCMRCNATYEYKPGVFNER